MRAMDLLQYLPLRVMNWLQNHPFFSCCGCFLAATAASTSADDSRVLVLLVLLLSSFMRGLFKAATAPVAAALVDDEADEDAPAGLCIDMLDMLNNASILTGEQSCRRRQKPSAVSRRIKSNLGVRSNDCMGG